MELIELDFPRICYMKMLESGVTTVEEVMEKWKSGELYAILPAGDYYRYIADDILGGIESHG